MVLLVAPAGAFAVTNASDIPPSCDIDIMDLMKINAGKSGRREVEIAQRIILKPDSVLEYNCFDDILKKADMFNTESRSSHILNTGGAYTAYVDGNFGTIYNSGYQASRSGCSVMDAVWAALKCNNFISKPYSEDHFFTFDELAGFDPREKPLACNDSERNARWAEDNAASDVGNVIVDIGP